MKKNIIGFHLLILCLFSCVLFGMDNQKVKLGLDVLLLNHLSELEGKRVGIITNQTGISSSGEHIVDILSSIEGLTIRALYAPEHGIRGDLPDATKMVSYVDQRTGIQVWSLYGEHLKPTEEMLEDVDVLVYDIQDVGARFYTFISTMGLAMEAASEHSKQFIVLDRPNLINGMTIEGPIIEEPYFSFVGQYPIPVRYGMTPGEMAWMIKGEKWMKGMDELNLKVIPMEGWQRTMWYDQTGLPWIKTSPNIPSIHTAAVYPGLCLVEALNISEGRGTMRPFEQIGAPWIDSYKLAEIMNFCRLPGIYFKPITFTPVMLPHAAPWNKYRDQDVNGVSLIITDREKMRPLQVMVHLLVTLKKHYPEELELRKNLERLIGIPSFRRAIDDLRPPEEILAEWEPGIQAFDKARQKYLLYK
ncbi:MAG: DUF1343 domain-containing protein [Candidatus Aminicenantes bacterium]|nr:MAG: DUF1343 domain-containing protein [Candidatus Aminicenantes bacterium]